MRNISLESDVAGGSRQWVHVTDSLLLRCGYGWLDGLLLRVFSLNHTYSPTNPCNVASYCSELALKSTPIVLWCACSIDPCPWAVCIRTLHTLAETHGARLLVVRVWWFTVHLRWFMVHVLGIKPARNLGKLPVYKC
jgi:hypothetical protein